MGNLLGRQWHLLRLKVRTSAALAQPQSFLFRGILRRGWAFKVSGSVPTTGGDKGKGKTFPIVLDMARDQFE